MDNDDPYDEYIVYKYDNDVLLEADMFHNVYILSNPHDLNLKIKILYKNDRG